MQTPPFLPLPPPKKRGVEYGEWLLTDVLKKEGKINDAVIENMLSWHHTGFHVHVGGRIWPEDETASGSPAKYIVRASFSQERMLYIPAEKSADGSAKVVYKSKDGLTEQTFDALDWLARLVMGDARSEHAVATQATPTNLAMHVRNERPVCRTSRMSRIYHVRPVSRITGPELEALVTFAAPHKSAMNQSFSRFCRQQLLRTGLKVLRF